MEQALFLLVGMVAGIVATGGALVALSLRSLRRRNRVSPRVPAPVPLGWLWSPRSCARLHRRLRRVVDGSRAWLELSPPAWETLKDAAAEIEVRAVALDDQLPALDRSPVSVRRRLLRELTVEIAELEGQVERLVRLTRESRSATTAEVDGRLEALELALRELTATTAALRQA